MRASDASSQRHQAITMTRRAPVDLLIPKPFGVIVLMLLVLLQYFSGVEAASHIVDRKHQIESWFVVVAYMHVWEVQACPHEVT